ncbi:MAG TPA: hypothetical protein VGN91_11945 [Bosea sp. (in: a-proteobacteria)]|jgi:hypothetical protein|nr:hypothetical protein [Bosea sp. (in: a-proteobacteria)]
MNRLIWFFDLYSQYKAGDSRAQRADGSEVSNGIQLLIYVACLVGVFAGPFALDAAKGQYPNLLQLFGSWSHVAWSILFAFVLTAFLFKVLLKPTMPIVGQIGTALAVGMCSGKLIPIALDTLTKVTT